ncbi:MAG: UV DNA damage repair endonuclease UvsE [Candidatus Omnitrophota bacterium]
MIRFGLCCVFFKEPIRFRTTTAKYLRTYTSKERLLKLAALCLTNARELQKAAEFCVANEIGCFRVNSGILPLKTYPQYAYQLADLPGGKTIRDQFVRTGLYARKHDLRFSFHPDQFVLLSSEREDVTQKSIAELEYQAEVSEWIGADVINIHGGGAYGDKVSALSRLTTRLKKLSSRIRTRLTIENDDRVYTPEDLLPVCDKAGMPLVYDVHHHRCLADGLSSEQVTQAALKTWNREPLFHLSSPREGWKSKTPQYHHDYIDPKDFPRFWYGLDITIEIEAKAKEVAVKRLIKKINVSAKAGLLKKSRLSGNVGLG